MKPMLLGVLLSLPFAAGLAYAGDSMKDTEFATKAAQGNLAEITYGHIALTKGQSERVKTFGQRIIDDHTKANEDLTAAATKSGIPLPTSPSQAQQDTTVQLGKVSAADFDKYYATMMVKDHEGDIALFREEAKSGRDVNLRQFAQNTLPVLETHLQMAQGLRPTQ